MSRATTPFGEARKFIWAIGALVIVLFAGIVVEGVMTWRAYSSTFGAKVAGKDWLNRKLTSYSVDTYEELLAIKRLQIYCLRFAQGAMDKDDFNIHRRQVIGSFATFLPGTMIGEEISQHESFKPAWEAAQKFLDAAKSLEDGKAKIGKVFETGEEAAQAWGLLAGSTISREFSLRDGMEEAIVEFRPLAVRSFVVFSILTAISAVAVALATYAAWRAWRAERRRFDRFELILATVGHDLRSPLQALVGAAKLAAADAVPAERNKFVEIVHERSAYFTRLLDDLIDLSRSASLSFVPVHVDVESWFNVATNRYRHAAEGKGLAFTSTFDGELSAILFDAHRLTQATDNLVLNAIRYTDVGAVDLHVSIVVENEGRGALLSIQVKDTGRGIDPSDHARIFQPFVRAQPGEHGLGLGLSIVASLAKSQGGKVQVLRSAVGVGSTFLFAVPVKMSEPRDTVPPTSVIEQAVEHPRTGDIVIPRVLVVDDDPLITTVVANLLPHMGFSADLAVGGKEGLRLAMERSYCAVITDVQMPDVDGFMLAQRLRLREGGQCPMLIALTAYTARKDVAERASVFDAMLRKPFDELELAELLDQAASRWAGVKASRNVCGGRCH